MLEGIVHNMYGVDVWALGTVIAELFLKRNPFYTKKKFLNSAYLSERIFRIIGSPSHINWNDKQIY
jgi:hypothetical protein